MSFAAVDIGNTAVKVALWREGAGMEVSSYRDIQAAFDAFLDSEARQAAYCTTRALNETERNRIRAMGWWEFGYGCRLPIENAYRTPETLGPDRLAGVIGAHSMLPDSNVLIADAGTALTLDVVSAAGVYEGGRICPGVKMRLDALHKFTSMLPRVEPDGDRPVLGYDTDTSMRMGAVGGVVNDIVATFLTVRHTHGCDALVITGGWSGFLYKDVSERMERDVFPLPLLREAPSLVLEGLRIAYEYNHDE